MSMIVGGSSTAFACICGVNMPSATRSIPSGAKPRSVGRSWLVVTMIEVPTGCQVPLSFYLGKYEVTQSQWQVVMGNNPSRFQGDNLPVEQMSWEDVQTFIRKLNAREGEDTYRLPTEAEWEYAARAGSTTAYSFGHSDSRLGEYAWYYMNSGRKTPPVGQLKPNAWGLYDIHGNVSEWAQDRYSKDYYT